MTLTQISGRAILPPKPSVASPGRKQTARTTNEQAKPTLAPSSEPATPPPTSCCSTPIEQTSVGATIIDRGQASDDAQEPLCPGRADIDGGQVRSDAHESAAAVEQSPPSARLDAIPRVDSPAGETTNIDRGQTVRDTQRAIAPVEQSPVLADPFLRLLAEVLDDLERTKIANENRLRQLTRTATDSDGQERGLGLDERHPDVARLAGMVEGLAALEHQATLNLQRAMRAHPLGPWIKAQKGVGDKQGARLLAAIGDPYWNTLHDRPRTVSELWAYCGLHVLPASQLARDAQPHPAGGAQTCDPGQVAIAARRQKGVRSNWSATAKMRAYLIAESCSKQLAAECKFEDGVKHHDGCGCSQYRVAYDDRKAHTEGRTHPRPCIRCGPAGHPAVVGSPLSAAHRHADALRVASKEILKDLWREARRIHGQAATP